MRPYVTGNAANPLAVRSAAWHVPETATPVPELPELASVPEDQRRTCLALGIDSVRADDGLDAAALAESAARQTLDQAGLSPHDLGALVVVESRAPKTLLSSEATRLQRSLQADAAITFTVGGLGCVSITPALLTARGLLCADADLRDVLVVHGSKPAGPGRYRHPVTVNGDGGQAMLLSRRGPVRLLDIAQETNGDHWDLFHVDYRNRPSHEWREVCRDTTTYTFRLAMETRSRLSRLLSSLLERNGLEPGDVRGYVSQNLSAAGFAFTEDSLGIELLPVCRENLRRFGHLGPNDVFLNLYTAMERKELVEGDRAVLINVSPVAAWSVLLVELGPQEPTT